jgi:hypothetical protein
MGWQGEIDNVEIQNRKERACQQYRKRQPLCGYSIAWQFGRRGL